MVNDGEDGHRLQKTNLKNRTFQEVQTTLYDILVTPLRNEVIN